MWYLSPATASNYLVYVITKKIAFQESRFGDIIRGEVAIKTNELLTSEEVSPDDIIPAIMELRSRLKQSGLLWNINPHRRLWYYTHFVQNNLNANYSKHQVHD